VSEVGPDPIIDMFALLKEAVADELEGKMDVIFQDDPASARAVRRLDEAEKQYIKERDRVSD
jgi:hypothetical protein